MKVLRVHGCQVGRDERRAILWLCAFALLLSTAFFYVADNFGSQKGLESWSRTMWQVQRDGQETWAWHGFCPIFQHKHGTCY